MNSLAKRTAKYFFKEGLKYLGVVIGLELILIIEWIALSYGEESVVDSVFNYFLQVGSILIILMNMLYAFYGPGWYDSIALSMGARRKDIFVGEIIKQLTFVVGNLLFFTAVCVAFGRSEEVNKLFISCIIAFALGPIGLIIGHKVKRFGKIFVFIIAFICAIIGGFVGVTQALSGDAFGFEIFSVIVKAKLFLFAVALVIFVLAEIWVYKLNQKSMVR